MSSPRTEAVIKSCVVIFILAWAAFFFAKKIDLSTADIGRHLRNGEVVLSTIFNSRTFPEPSSVLSKNYYSYTYPDFPVINHHWGSGAIFYVVWKALGFEGLSLLYLALMLAAFFIMFRVAERYGGFRLAAVFALLLIPVLAERREVRPEIFSYFFCALFFSFLWKARQNDLSIKKLWLLPLFEIFWANTHIYFLLGPVLAGIFWLEALLTPGSEKPKKIKQLTLIAAAVSAACFVTPFGWEGVLYPFRIFQNYGYRLVENMSVAFLEKLHVVHPNYIYFKAALAILAVSFIALFLARRRCWSWALFFTALFFSFMACKALRNFTLFGLFSLPILSINFRSLLPEKVFWRRSWMNVCTVFVSISICVMTAMAYRVYAGDVGIGLRENNAASADFFVKNGLRGPIFNNYDIGGYLIYYLFPKERVFVDNRPEAYPEKFFKEVYIPSQENPDRWKELDAKHHFNVIYFAYHDLTPWGQNFLIERVKDSDWAPVFADAYVVIFVRRSFENREIFTKYELPRSSFNVIQN